LPNKKLVEKVQLEHLGHFDNIRTALHSLLNAIEDDQSKHKFGIKLNQL